MGGIDNQSMPPMDDNMEMDNNDISPMDDMPMGGEEFDAGINVDSNADPKKYIQQLSGKLSQELRKYNQEQPQPDTELNKYVAGMIIPQASQGMTDQDKEEVINKLEKGNVDDVEQEPTNDMDFGTDEPIDNNIQPTDNNMPMESVKKQMRMKDINEIIDSLLDKEIRKRGEKKVTNNKLSNNNPFLANR
jgi:hypothetical protein